MAWNEPGNQGGEDKDPWSGRRKTPNPQKSTEFEELVYRLRKRMASLLQLPAKGGKNRIPERVVWVSSLMFLVVLFLIWVVAGFFIVEPSEQAVIKRFGRYYTTLNSGLHWIPRLIEAKDVIDIAKIHNYLYEAQAITKDNNIVSTAIAVRYRIDNPRKLLFSVTDPKESLLEAVASGLDQVIGQSTMDDILAAGRERIGQATKEQVDDILARYDTGIKVTDVSLQSVKVPDGVKNAFADTIKAQEDKQKYINKVQTYVMQLEPIAKGEAGIIMENAKAYKQQVVLKAQADVASFLALLAAYQKHPRVTRDRLSLDAAEYVLLHSSKILVGIKSANNLLYLPIDKLIEAGSRMQESKASLISSQQKAEQISAEQLPLEARSTRPARTSESSALTPTTAPEDNQ